MERASAGKCAVSDEAAPSLPCIWLQTQQLFSVSPSSEQDSFIHESNLLSVSFDLFEEAHETPLIAPSP